MNRLVIIGASGHGKVVADIAAKNGYTDIAFLDDDESLTECAGYPVIGKSNLAFEYHDADFFIAIGNPKIRERVQSGLINAGLHVVTLIHPNAVIADDVKIGIGTVIMAGAVVNPGTDVGDGCIINTSASVDHDNVLEDYVHVSVGSHLCGTVQVGKSTWIGTGATISNNINVCSGCMIGAGAVVIKDITEMGTYVGVPAGEMIKNEDTDSCK